MGRVWKLIPAFLEGLGTPPPHEREAKWSVRWLQYAGEWWPKFWVYQEMTVGTRQTVHAEKDLDGQEEGPCLHEAAFALH